VNWEHLKTYIWLRWRLSVNQVRRTGAIGVIISAILTALMMVGGFITFIAGLLVGILALSRVEPWVMMAVWDGVAAAFVFFWLIGLMTELQRTELLSLNNFMHLPISLAGAFLINYLGSSFGLSLVLFPPAMIGLAIGLTLSRGIAMLVLFPLIVAFFLMMTAVTYQFRGWLASMMTNPRRRRTIVAVISLLFILITQLPNLLTNFNPRFKAREQKRQEIYKELAELGKAAASGKIAPEEFKKLQSSKLGVLHADRAREDQRDQATFRLVNMIVPLGWLPYGSAAAVQGRALPALAGFIGMGIIGIASLRRSYQTSIRMYLGDFTSGRATRKIKAEAVPKESSRPKVGIQSQASFLEKKLPWISEQASAVFLVGVRSMMRAPELKMLMLTPVIMLIVFGGMLAGKGGGVPVLARPLVALGLAAFLLIISLTGFLGNNFAYDRNGFRAFVLSCAPRRDILLGKNLSLLPVAIALMTLSIGVFYWKNPMRLDYVAAVLIQTIPMYLLLCLAANLLAIFSPMALKPGSGQPSAHQGIRIFFQMLFILIVPIPMTLTLIPLGIEMVLRYLKWAPWFPAFLVFGMVQFAVVLWLYLLVINWQGGLLQQREQKILEVVSSKAE
jgi:ABC-2 type transport system permease protein